MSEPYKTRSELLNAMAFLMEHRHENYCDAMTGEPTDCNCSASEEQAVADRLFETALLGVAPSGGRDADGATVTDCDDGTCGVCRRCAAPTHGEPK